jgi:hypothetical protein
MALVDWLKSGWYFIRVRAIEGKAMYTQWKCHVMQLELGKGHVMPGKGHVMQLELGKGHVMQLELGKGMCSWK